MASHWIAIEVVFPLHTLSVNPVVDTPVTHNCTLMSLEIPVDGCKYTRGAMAKVTPNETENEFAELATSVPVVYEPVLILAASIASLWLCDVAAYVEWV